MILKVFIAVTCCVGVLSAQPQKGAEVSPSSTEANQKSSLVGRIKGQIVWSTSRSNTSHDLWIMNADGTQERQLTNSNNVDWYPRFSPDGKKVLFNRSKSGWVSENDADQPDSWDLWVINKDGSGEKKLIEKATWGSWHNAGKEIIFSRAGKVFKVSVAEDLAISNETLLLDGDAKIKKGVILQQPNMSPDGKFIAITLRGSIRETGIWNMAENTWQQSGEGCQIDWMPNNLAVYRINSTGNGGSAAPSEVLMFPFENGKQVGKVGFFGPAKVNRLMDLPGARSHEYFPKVDQTGAWLVWGATSKGHDHDIYDYELYLWKIGSPVDQAVRITYHTGNDRWPDIYLEK